MNWFIGLLFCTLIGYSCGYSDLDELKDNLHKGLIEYIITGHKPEYLDRTLKGLHLEHLFRWYPNRELKSGALCAVCDIFFALMFSLRRSGGSKELITQVAVDICHWIGIESEEVCRGTIESNMDIFLYIIDNKPELDAIRACDVVFQSSNCTKPAGFDWAINIPTGYGPPRPAVNNTNSPLKIIHLTDVHYDRDYAPGSNAECGNPICCDPSQGLPETPEAAAGQWGDHRMCDTPWHSITDALDHITTKQPKFDYVYYTGDIISHRVWKTSNAANFEDISKTLAQFQTSFGLVPVYPILGNHESHPLNVFSPSHITDPLLSTQWVFDLSANEWARWLPEETKATIQRGGYYTVVPKPGFRIIALNSNVCYVYNWWLLYDPVDPFGQLQWLADTLLIAEQNGEVVHILSHIPSGSGACLKEWSREYNRIIQRFSNTIAAQFNGHTHNDEKLVYFNKTDPAQPINIAWNGGSLTTYTFKNPNYMIYDVDPINMEVTDYEQWMYKIFEANLNPELAPNWYKLYSFKEAYGLTGATTTDLGLLAYKLASNKTLAQQYHRFKVRESTLEECDDDCLLDNVCSMVTPEVGDSTQCDMVTDVWRNIK